MRDFRPRRLEYNRRPRPNCRLDCYGFTPPRAVPRRVARGQEADPRAGPRLRARLLSRHLRDVRLRADEPDRRVRGLSAAISALALRHGIRTAAQAASLWAWPHLRDGYKQ